MVVVNTSDFLFCSFRFNRTAKTKETARKRTAQQQTANSPWPLNHHSCATACAVIACGRLPATVSADPLLAYPLPAANLRLLLVLICFSAVLEEH